MSASNSMSTSNNVHATTVTGATDVNQTAVNAKNAMADNAAAAYSAVVNHPLTQNVKDTVANGPVAENVKDQSIKTQNEFSNLAAARTTPATPAATGQKLTHYHSFFSSLLSWDNPRASGIAYASIVLFIFGARYLNLLSYLLKLTWVVLGVTCAAEVAGKVMFSNGFTSQIRPRKYYIVPKETLDAMIGDVHELINFFVIESQRIVFAENVYASGAAFLGAFLSYYLIRIVPVWGMALISTSVIFLAPLLYKSNKQFIDENLRNATDIVSQQTEQVKSIASHHASVAAQTTKQYAGDYAAKAQDIMGVQRSASPVEPKKSAATTSAAPLPPKSNTGSSTSSMKTPSAGATSAAPLGSTSSSGISSTRSTDAGYSSTGSSAGMAPIGSSPAPLTTPSALGTTGSTGTTSSTLADKQYSSADFPTAPQQPFVKSTPIANEFITAPAPSVQSTASAMKTDDPLLI